MPKFRVEQYELHVTTYEVEGVENAGEAIREVYEGGGTQLTTEYVEIDEWRGMPIDELSREEIKLLELGGSNEIVPSIREVTEVTDQ